MESAFKKDRANRVTEFLRMGIFSPEGIIRSAGTSEKMENATPNAGGIIIGTLTTKQIITSGISINLDSLGLRN